MDKFEKIVPVPACHISKEVADRVAQRVFAIAEEQVNSDYVQALRLLAPRLNVSPEEAIRQYSRNIELRRLLVARKDRTTFISPHGNMQYSGRDVLYEEIPMDPIQVIIDVPGTDAKYLNISLTTDLMQTFPLHTANKILIQGADRAWVNALYEEFQSELAASKKVLRDLVYRWFRPLGLLAFVGLCFVEFRLYQLLRPTFTFLTPLTGLASIAVFVIFLVNHYLVFSVGGRATRYLYPYFELEDRLSERRKDLRKWWMATVLALYGSGLWALITTVMKFG